MFTFTSLLGAQSTSPASQSILELDGGIKILIDVGWDSGFDSSALNSLETHIPTLSLILLTHATMSHLGAYAHCCKHYPHFTRVPVYATTPVVSLGRTLLQDVYASTPLASSTIPQAALEQSAYSASTTAQGVRSKILLQRPTPEEIARYFSRINPLKYSQPHEPLPSPAGLTITAYSAGHSLGGTMWHIQHGSESIVYAVDWNQAREHVLAGAAWLGPAGGEVIDTLRRPTALVCSSRGSSRSAVENALKKRDETLMNHIKDTVRQGGTVLIPTDSTARVLELAFMLESAWHADAREGRELSEVRACVVSKSCGATMRFARSMLEWMEESMVREFESVAAAARQPGGRREAKSFVPFDFRHLKLIEKRSRFASWAAKEGPKVILASDVTMEWGFSKEAIEMLAGDPKNLVVLTEPAPRVPESEATLQSYLWSLFDQQSESSASVISANGGTFTKRTVSTEPLSATETPLYQAYLARQRQLQSAAQGGQAAVAEAAEEAADDDFDWSSSSSSEDSDDGIQGKLLVTSALSRKQHKHDAHDGDDGVKTLLKRKGVFDWDVRGRRGKDTMFPYAAKKRRKDAFEDGFGAGITPADYLRAEERAGDADAKAAKKPNFRVEDKATAASGNGAAAAAAGKKRKLGDVDAARSVSPASDEAGADSEGSGSESGDDDEAEDEAATEAGGAAEGPRKLVVAQSALQLQLRIAFVDFSGRHDKRSFHMLVPKIRPRKMIIVGGDADETLALATHCRALLAAGGGGGGGGEAESEKKNGGDEAMFTPEAGERVDASMDADAWVVRLSDALYRGLRWQPVRKGLRVAAVTGLLTSPRAHHDEDDGTPLEHENAPEHKKLKQLHNHSPSPSVAAHLPLPPPSAPPVLDVLPPALAAARRATTAPLHIGDLRLADLRKIMQAEGYGAEFRGEGTLLVGGRVVVRKSGTGGIEIEGVMEGGGVEAVAGMRVFVEVRRRVYECLAVVAGA